MGAGTAVLALVWGLVVGSRVIIFDGASLRDPELRMTKTGGRLYVEIGWSERLVPPRG